MSEEIKIEEKISIEKVYKEINSVDEVIKLYYELGKEDYIGEKINQVEHAIQSAMLAEEKKIGVEFEIGALLHDIGHLIGIRYNLSQMEGVGTLRHEEIGAMILKNIGFSSLVCNIVKNHVNAKRYLITKDPNYLNSLSEASKVTFKYQGGLMSEQEFNSFDLDSNKELYIEMRLIDDKAKIEYMILPEFKEYKLKMSQCINLD